MDSKNLDLVFSALSDATRRGILASLASGERTVHELTSDFDISQPAVSRHLRVLDSAGLVRREKRGRETIVTAATETAAEAAHWLTHYVDFWTVHFDQMDVILTKQRERPDGR
ncbi:metalloregulator ArsR/SmtB family transcription factor [uncultured Roseibium sp.]|uniref:ArsR/SmtB family transcription factor n=1 Tax=uncultured Roseibium sp. TaxID=1936171 RepID=UPI00262CABC8|nr:metalloregulator ArsR/SmtB family transcription factor [uncultured Roseibium sp.]